VLAVDVAAVELDASTRRRCPCGALAVLAVEAVAVELDAPRRAPRRGGAALAVLAVDAGAVELDASTRRRWPAVLAVEAVAVELDARLDVGALPSPPMSRPSRWTHASTRRRCPRGACGSRGRRAGLAPRRGGAALAVLAVDGAAVEVDAHLDAVALPSRCCR
jgi:hypothetical protein